MFSGAQEISESLLEAREHLQKRGHKRSVADGAVQDVVMLFKQTAVTDHDARQRTEYILRWFMDDHVQVFVIGTKTHVYTNSH